MVFCEPTGRSVPLARCATCGFGAEVEGDATGRPLTVACSRFTLRSTGPTPGGDEPLKGTCAAHVAALLPVGLSLVRQIVCVSHDASLRLAIPAVLALEPFTGGVAVVDDQRRFLGTLPRLVAPDDQKAATHAIRGAGTIEEGASLATAFGTMASAHVRELVVLCEDGTFAGFLRDVDALRFVAHVSRTGLRPEPRIRCA